MQFSSALWRLRSNGLTTRAPFRTLPKWRIVEGREELGPPLASGCRSNVRRALYCGNGPHFCNARSTRMSDRRRASRGSCAGSGGQEHRSWSRSRRARGGLTPPRRCSSKQFGCRRADGDVMLGYAAALFADGRASSAELTLEQALAAFAVVDRRPSKLAQLRSRMGKKDGRRRRWSGRSSYIRGAGAIVDRAVPPPVADGTVPLRRAGRGGRSRPAACAL